MKKIGWAIALLIFSIQTNAQISAPGLDGKQYTPQNTQTNKKGAGDEQKAFNNTIYANLGQAARGIGSMSYQRMVHKKIAVKATLGYCFIIDPTSFFLHAESYDGYGEIFTLPSYLMEDTELQPKTSFYTDFAVKYCSKLREADLEDVSYRMYVGVDFRRYNYQLIMPNRYRNTWNDESIVITPVKQHAFHIITGMQVYRSMGYSWELYTGIGIMNRKGYDFSRNLNVDTYYYPNSTLTTYSTVQLLMGLNIGFSF
jgi:hypothetical protein